MMRAVTVFINSFFLDSTMERFDASIVKTITFSTHTDLNLVCRLLLEKKKKDPPQGLLQRTTQITGAVEEAHHDERARPTQPPQDQVTTKHCNHNTQNTN